MVIREVIIIKTRAVEDTVVAEAEAETVTAITTIMKVEVVDVETETNLKNP
jgi:acetolactate synthase small subunit